MKKVTLNLVVSYLSKLVSVSGIFSIKSFFENDNSKIVSQRGKSLLSDEEKMKTVFEKINTQESANNNYNEVYL